MIATTVQTAARGLAIALSTLAGACASTHTEGPPSLIPDTTGSAAPAAAYQLTRQEMKYDCRKLTGAMQVRILQIRDYAERSKPSLAARGAQAVSTPVFGGTTHGIDPEGEHQRDLAMLEAYNRRLAEKNCKTFDLAAELKGRGAKDMPTPTGSAKQE